MAYNFIFQSSAVRIFGFRYAAALLSRPSAFIYRIEIVQVFLLRNLRHSAFSATIFS